MAWERGGAGGHTLLKKVEGMSVSVSVSVLCCFVLFGLHACSRSLGHYDRLMYSIFKCVEAIIVSLKVTIILRLQMKKRNNWIIDKYINGYLN